MAEEKSVLNIQVNDETFKRFQEAFAEYSKELKDQPEAWQKLNKAMGALNRDFNRGSKKVNDEFAAANAVASALSEEMRKIVKGQNAFGRETDRSAKSMNRLQRAVHGVGRGIASIAKFAGMLGGIGAGVGLASMLFGIPELAGSAVRQYRGSRSLGLTVGQQRAFDVNMSPLMAQPQAYLQAIANAQNTPQGAVGLSILTGLTPGQVASENTAKLAALAARKMHSFEKQHTGMFLESFLKAYLLQGVFPLSMARLLGNEPGKKINQYTKAAISPGQIKKFEFSNESALANFYIALRSAGALIENTLIKKLSSLGTSLADLSNKLASGAVMLINNVLTKNNLESIARGISEAASALGSKAFATDIKKFVQAMGDIINFVLAVAKKVKAFWGNNAPPGTVQKPPHHALTQEEKSKILSRDRKEFIKKYGNDPSRLYWAPQSYVEPSIRFTGENNYASEKILFELQRISEILRTFQSPGSGGPMRYYNGPVGSNSALNAFTARI